MIPAGLEYRTCCDHPDCTTCAGRGGYYQVAAAPAVAITQAATSEPVAPEVVTAGWQLVPTTPQQGMINAFIAEYERRGGSESGCYHAFLKAAPVAHLAGTTPKTEAPSVTCAAMRALCSNCGGTGEVHRADGEYVGTCDCMFQTLPSSAALSAQQAGVQEARTQAGQDFDVEQAARAIESFDDRELASRLRAAWTARSVQEAPRGAIGVVIKLNGKRWGQLKSQDTPVGTMLYATSSEAPSEDAKDAASVKTRQQRQEESWPNLPGNSLAPWARLKLADAEIKDLRAALAAATQTEKK